MGVLILDSVYCVLRTMTASDQDEVYGELFGRVVADDTAERWMQQLQELYEALHTSESFERMVAERLTVPDHKRLMALFEARGVALDDASAVGEELRALREYLQGLPELLLRLGFAPQQSWLEEVLAWLNVHGPGPARLHLEMDRSLVGGAQIGWQGKLRDASLKDRLEKVLTKKKATL